MTTWQTIALNWLVIGGVAFALFVVFAAVWGISQVVVSWLMERQP